MSKVVPAPNIFSPCRIFQYQGLSPGGSSRIDAFVQGNLKNFRDCGFIAFSAHRQIKQKDSSACLKAPTCAIIR